jgi:hypothetical protein
MATRLQKDCALSNDEDKWRVGKGFIVETLGFTEKTLREMPASDFENWAVKKLNGHGNKIKVGDKGIDGRIYPMHALPGVRGTAVGELGFTDVWFPIQVKQQDKVGSPEITQFEAVMIREKRTLGYYVSFDFSKGALEEIERFQKEQGLTIKPLTVRDLLEV